MQKPIRWGILGAAKIARTALAPAIHAAQGAQLVALATSDPARAAAFRATVPDLRVCDYDALLAAPDIDAIYIPLPNHLHVDWTLRAIAAGKHVLCEKPMALNASDIGRLIAARDASGLQVAEAFMVMHHPQWHRLRALLAEGAIGTLGHVEGMFTYHNTDPANIRNRPETGGGGLLDIGVYPCVTTRFATGAEPKTLRADIRRESGVDTFARVWADFDRFTLSFHCGMRLQRRQDMVFHGDTGWIRMPAPFNPPSMGEARIELHRADGSVLIESFPEADQYRLMIEGFGAAIRGEAPFACPLEFSAGNQSMIDAIFAADPV
jgi:predicted dehydrogenase